MQTHLVSKVMDQNLAVILWQFNYDALYFGKKPHKTYSKYSNVGEAFAWWLWYSRGNTHLL